MKKCFSRFICFFHRKPPTPIFMRILFFIPPIFVYQSKNFEILENECIILVMIKNLIEDSFYLFFYESCKELFNECKITEEELFYPSYKGNLKEIKETDISHDGLNYFSFLKKINEKKCFLLSSETKEENADFGRIFCSKLFNTKEFWKLFSWMKIWKMFSESSEDKKFFLSKCLFSFQYLETNEYGKDGKKTRKGLKMPVFSIPNCWKEKQNLYGTYELLRIMTSFEKMPSDSYEHFYNTYILFLKKKFLSFKKNEIDRNLILKNRVSKELLKILNKEEWNDRKIFDDFEKAIKEREYAKAYDLFFKGCKPNLTSEETLATIENKFTFLQASTDLSEESIYHNQYVSWNKENNAIALEKDAILEEQMEKYKHVIQNELFSASIKKFIKASETKNNKVSSEKLTEIKQKIILYSLSCEDLSSLEKIKELKEKVCNEFKDNENELLHLYVKQYPFAYRKMQEAVRIFYSPIVEPDIEKVKLIRKRYSDIEKYFIDNNDFPEYVSGALPELAYFVLQDEYTYRNSTHKSFEGELIRNLESYKKKINKKIKNDDDFVATLSSLIDYRIAQIPKRKSKIEN